MHNPFDHPVLFALIVVLCYPVYRGLRGVFFPDKDDFWQAVKYFLCPDMLSLFKGRFWDDWDAEFKLKFYLFVCIAFPFAVYEICMRISS